MAVGGITLAGFLSGVIAGLLVFWFVRKIYLPEDKTKTGVIPSTKGVAEDEGAQSDLVSMASHQLRTPLSVIDWYSESLLSSGVGSLNEQQYKYVDEIHRTNQHVLKLVNMLLNASRLESGKYVIAPEPTNIAHLVDDVLKGLKFNIEERGLRVETEHEENIPTIRVDRNFMQLVVENVVTNAVHYTPKGGSIWVSVKHVEPNTKIGNEVVGTESILISVQDTGIGIPSSEQGFIFQKSFRANNAKKHRTNGTGLGLYIVKSILDQTNGSIWFQSEESVGTTFYIAIPVRGVHKDRVSPTSTI